MKTLILSFVLLISIGCNKNDDENSFEPQTIEPVLISNGQGGVVISDTNKYSTSFTTEASWLSFKTSHILNTSFNPSIDFSQFDVIVCVDASRTTGGYDISIASITEYQNNIVVDVQYIGSGDATQMPTRPFIIVKIPKKTKPIIFQ